MGKMQEAQQKMEETKKRLDTVFVDSEIENGMIKVTSNVNMKITDINIADQLLQNSDKEALEDLMIVAINKVLAKAKEIQEVEMAKVAQGSMPDLGGLGKLFGK